MLSKRFFAWVGVGVLGVAAIPAIAAPHLSRLALRHGATAPAMAKPAATPTKSVVLSKAKTPTAAAAAHKTLAASPKKGVTPTAAKSTTKSKTLTAKKALPKASSANATKKATPSKAKLAAGKKPTAAATAKKLLH